MNIIGRYGRIGGVAIAAVAYVLAHGSVVEVASQKATASVSTLRPTCGTKPLIEDRILQEEIIPRKKPKTTPKGVSPDRRSPVVIS